MEMGKVVLSPGVDGAARPTCTQPHRYQNRQYQQGGKMAPDRTANRYNPIGSGGGYGGGTSAGYPGHVPGQNSFYNFSTPSFSGGNYTSFSSMSAGSATDGYARY
ncbi:hypothetical protein Pmani_015852 [Petrolisthes manimaculis]|uniref:Uncharacterized protein n=1 Tax=Petrolisthes manimaculis TaxID=1843537 RepID=A0AAE1PRH4_9EUCA|nr:hypothetical protein Pmani_015852 [Petrolisthes manimaculis]